MHPNSTKSSYAPETLSAALTQVTCAGDYNIDLIMDNKAAMLDVERVVRGHRSQGRAVQAFHQLANQRFKAARPAPR